MWVYHRTYKLQVEPKLMKELNWKREKCHNTRIMRDSRADVQHSNPPQPHIFIPLPIGTQEPLKEFSPHQLLMGRGSTHWRSNPTKP